MIHALIVEDETAAAYNLQRLLQQVEPHLVVVDVLETVVDAVAWFEHNPHPDVVFMDIHLADGRAFAIFDRVQVTSPIIFTTAYDQYALEAFRVNSIDYLLKPLKVSELSRALEKLLRFTPQQKEAYVQRFQHEVVPVLNVHSFLIPMRDKLMPLAVTQIAFFYTSRERAIATTYQGELWPLDQTLDALMAQLPEADFFRANRQFIVAREAIQDLSIWFGSRVSLNLKMSTPERIIVSKARTPELKRWFVVRS